MNNYEDPSRDQLTAVLIGSIETELARLTEELGHAEDPELKALIVDTIAKLDATRAHLLWPIPRPEPTPTVRQFIYSLIETLEVVDAGSSLVR